MFRLPFAIVVAALICSGPIPCFAVQSPAPHASAVPAKKKVPGLSNKVHLPKYTTTTVSAADCNRRANPIDGSRGELGSNGAGKSQTLVAVPLGAGNTASATHQAQIADICAHQRQ